MAAQDSRELDLKLTVTPFGSHGLLKATSDQMPNLMVTGTDEDDLFECLGPVLDSLFEAQGEKVQLVTLDRTKGPRDLRVHLEVRPTP